MRAGHPSITARMVALGRARLDRPKSDAGDTAAEDRLYASLGFLPRGVRPVLRLPVPGLACLLRLPFFQGGLGSGWGVHMARRTRFFDSVTQGAIGAGITQVVIVAAGYDGRPLRFASPNVRWFEIDHPATQADKRARLSAVGAATAPIAFVPVDLVTGDLPGSLVEAGFDRRLPAVFLVEGLLGYLPRDATAKLLSDLGALAAPGSRVGAGFPVAMEDTSPIGTLRHQVRGLAVRAIGEPWLSRFSSGEVDGLLAASGWSVRNEGGSARRHEGRAGVLVECERNRGGSSGRRPGRLPGNVPGPTAVRAKRTAKTTAGGRRGGRGGT